MQKHQTFPETSPRLRGGDPGDVGMPGLSMAWPVRGSARSIGMGGQAAGAAPTLPRVPELTQNRSGGWAGQRPPGESPAPWTRTPPERAVSESQKGRCHHMDMGSVSLSSTGPSPALQGGDPSALSRPCRSHSRAPGHGDSWE